MDVVVEQMPVLRVGAVRHIGRYDQVSEAFGRLGEIAGPAGLLHRPGAAMMAIYHDDPDTKQPEQLQSDAAVIVAEDVALPAGLVERRVAGGRYARVTHVGPYEQLGPAWGRFKGELRAASGHQMADGPSYEIYRNDPARVSKEELRTDLYIPLA